jgi:hypothetical protein
MTYYIVRNGLIEEGPHRITAPEIKRAARCGNPDMLSADALAAAGVLPEWRESVAAPLGWQAPVVEAERVAVYASGAPEERAAVTRAQRVKRLQQLRSQERVRRQTGVFTYAGHQYAADRDESIPLITSAAIAAQTALAAGPDAVAAYEAALGAGWRDVDGVPRLAAAADIIALHSAFVSHGAAHDVASQALKAQIDAPDADLDALKSAITDDACWP